VIGKKKKKKKKRGLAKSKGVLKVSPLLRTGYIPVAQGRKRDFRKVSRKGLQCGELKWKWKKGCARLLFRRRQEEEKDIAPSHPRAYQKRGVRFEVRMAVSS